MNKIKMPFGIITALAIAIIISSFSSCTNPTLKAPDSGSASGEGSITIKTQKPTPPTLNAKLLNAKTLIGKIQYPVLTLRPTDTTVLEATTYTYSLVGPNSTTVNASNATGTDTFTNLIVGNWTVTVTTKNAFSVILMTGTANFSISSGNATPVTVPLFAASGTGTVNITLILPTTVAAITGTLQNLTTMAASSTISSSNITSSSGTWTYQDTLAAGSYQMSLTLYDNNSNIVGMIIEAVDVFAGISTDPTLTFRTSDINQFFTVTYNANGATGTPPTDSKNYVFNASVTVSGVGGLVNSGNSFAGWNTSAAGTGTNHAAGTTFGMGTSSVILYPIWIPGNITFSSSGTSIIITVWPNPTSSLTIPTGVTEIGPAVFSGCTALADVTLPSSITSIGDYAFWDCYNLTSITIPPSIISIGDNAFGHCKMSSITLPASIASFGTWAFYDCPNLTSVTLPANLASIPDFTFDGCGLTSIVLPSTISSIGTQAFALCSDLSSVTVNATTPPAMASGSNAFYGCAAGLLIHVPSVALAAAYQAAPGWSDYSSQIVSP